MVAVFLTLSHFLRAMASAWVCLQIFLAKYHILYWHSGVPICKLFAEIKSDPHLLTMRIGCDLKDKRRDG